MVRLWVLAGKLLVPALQNDAIRGLHEQRSPVHACYFEYVYDNTVAGSPLRRFIVDQMVRVIDDQSLNTCFSRILDLFPKQMLADVILAQKVILPDLNMETYAVKAEDYFVEEGMDK